MTGFIVHPEAILAGYTGPFPPAAPSFFIRPIPAPAPFPHKPQVSGQTIAFHKFIDRQSHHNYYIRAPGQLWIKSARIEIQYLL